MVLHDRCTKPNIVLFYFLFITCILFLNLLCHHKFIFQYDYPSFIFTELLLLVYHLFLSLCLFFFYIGYMRNISLFDYSMSCWFGVVCAIKTYMWVLLILFFLFLSFVVDKNTVTSAAGRLITVYRWHMLPLLFYVYLLMV
jgi:hypothetical protein